jgi:hypothetical protein
MTLGCCESLRAQSWVWQLLQVVVCVLQDPVSINPATLEWHC